MAAKNTIEDLLSDEIKDLYSAEKQLTKAIPKMAKGANSPELRAAFEGHLKETENQVVRLEKAAQLLGIKPSGKKCMGMEGLLAEGGEILAEEGEEDVLDLGIIGAGTRVEHYEMAGYMTAIGLAERLEMDDVVNLLQASLAEEQNADKKLRALSGSLVRSAPVGEQMAKR